VIREIDGIDDPAASSYQHVGDHGWLRARGLFVAEGRLLVNRLIAKGLHRIDSLLVTPAAFAALETELVTVDAPILIAAPAVLNGITGFNFHRGCLALAHRPPSTPLEDVVAGSLLLGLEAVGNPDNVGGLFRTAAAFGVSGLLLDGRTADPLYRKALRTSMGAVLEVPFASVVSWPTAFDVVRRRGHHVVALTPDPAAESLADFVQSMDAAPLLVMVGAEGAGLTAGVLAQSARRVRIPITNGVDSLNVSVAAGVALARIVEARQRL
jgi:tRNA G18 (ribose-2'-O)-methylase SpoU